MNNDSNKVTEKSNILRQMKGGSDTDVPPRRPMVVRIQKEKFLTPIPEKCTFYDSIEEQNSDV